MFTCNFEKQRAFRHISLRADYVIAGGGMTGVCSAITAARAGVKVILVQDRPVLGGNASSEVRLWVLGATSHMGNNNRWSREGGVLDEILVENTFRNKEGNPVLFDMVLMDKVLAEPNITLLLNTVVYKVEKNDTRTISRLTAINPQNGTEYTIEGDLFADCTGDGTLGYLAGASFRMGAEEKEEYGEGFAPDKQEYGELLGHSILFYMKDTGRPVKYTAPDFAIKDAERHIPKLQNPNYFNPAQHGCKYWWLEYGGRLDTVTDTERIKFELWRVVYGVWDYIKNSGKFPQAENLTLEWAGLFPGKRESRRFTGLYTITQQDIIEQHTHYDAVAYGGWSIDLHPSDGVFSPKNGCNQWHSKGVYQIPYRCYVTPDLDNLFIGGRIMSSSHVAMFDAIGQAKRISGVSGIDYISNPYVREHRLCGEVRDVGYDTNLNFELLAAMRPDLMLLYGVTGENTIVTGKLRELGIPYIYVGDYMEESPLGKAEWLVLAAALCDLRAAGADTLQRIARDYQALKAHPAPDAPRPKVMLNTPYRDTWFLPSSQSYMIRLIEDAGGEYVYTKNYSDTSVAVDMEEAYLLANAADFWLNVGPCNTLAELTAQNPKFSGIPVVRSRNVYNNNRRQTPAGGSDFWESGVVRPDLVLRDLRTIFSGDSVPTCYYKRLE